MVLAMPVVYDPTAMERRQGPHNVAETKPGTLGDFVRQRREELGLKQPQLADRIVDLGGKMDQSDISDLERGVVNTPRHPRMVLLSRALRVSVAELYEAAGVPDYGKVAEASPIYDAEPDEILDAIEHMHGDRAEEVREWIRTRWNARKRIRGKKPTPLRPSED